MPNFIAKNIDIPLLPIEINGVEFKKLFNGRTLDLLLCKSENVEFFITIKPTLKKDINCIIVKGEKLTRPTNLNLLQKALNEIKYNFCSGILNDATAIKTNLQNKKNNIIKTENGILNLLKNNKFNKIFIEIGFGSGRHLLLQAKENKDTLVIGIEIYKPSIEQVNKLAMSQGLENIALLNSDARIFFSLLESNLVDRVFLHFPIPWDDAPHRRVISDEFCMECKRVLKPGGTFELRSDSEAYVRYAFDVFCKFKTLDLHILKNQDSIISSKYEDRWKRAQKDIFDLIYRCFEDSSQGEKFDNLEFEGEFDAEKIRLNFKNFSLKFDKYFIHFEEIYKSGSDILLKVSLGAFCLPQHCFILLSDKVAKYFITKPLSTVHSFAAHKKIEEILKYGRDCIG